MNDRDVKIKPDPMSAGAEANVSAPVLGSIVIKNCVMEASVSALVGKGKIMPDEKTDREPMQDLKVADAKLIAEAIKAEGVIIIGIDKLPDGRFKGVSYGTDRMRCQLMGLFLDKIVRMLQTEADDGRQG